MGNEQWQVVLAVVAIVLLALFLINIEKFFPTPKSTLSEPTRLELPFDAARGNHPEASHTLVEFTDFQCPYCKAALPVLQELEQVYGEDLNIVVAHFPVGELHPQAPKAAEAAECARMQGKFQEYHDLLFQNQEDLSVPTLLQYAEILQVDESFADCLTNGESRAAVEADVRMGLSAGVRGTPTFFADGLMIEGLQPSSSFTAIFGVP